MPPRPFPYPLKLGIDVCHIPRIKSILTSRAGQGEKASRPLSRFLHQVLTWPEHKYFLDRFGGKEAAYRDIDKVSQYLAGRWAAKEACRKACTHLGRSNGMHNIMILPVSRPEETTSLDSKSSAPQGLILRDRLRPYLAEGEARSDQGARLDELGNICFDINGIEGQFCEVSITHDNDFAHAVAMVPAIPDTWRLQNDGTLG